MCCPSLSSAYLYALNTLTAIAGLGVVGVAAWQLHSFNDISSVLSKDMLWLVVAAGGAVFFLSLLGCRAARDHGSNKCTLAIYATLVAAVALAQFGGGIVVADYAGKLDVENLNADKLSQKVSDFVTCSYDWCCTGEAGDTCNQDVWNSDGFCSVLPKKLQSGGSSCTSRDDYNDAILSFLQTHSRDLAIAAIVLGSVQLLALLSSLCLICHRTETPEERRQKEALKQAEAGQLVYGSQPPAYAV